MPTRFRQQCGCNGLLTVNQPRVGLIVIADSRILHRLPLPRQKPLDPLMGRSGFSGLAAAGLAPIRPIKSLKQQITFELSRLSLSDFQPRLSRLTTN